VFPVQNKIKPQNFKGRTVGKPAKNQLKNDQKTAKSGLKKA